MSTAVQASVASLLEDLGFESVPPPENRCGGPREFKATLRAESLLRPVLDGEKKLTVDSDGSVS